LQLWKNGALYSTIGSWTSSAAFTSSGNTFTVCGNKTIRIRTGDYLQVYIVTSLASGTWVTNPATYANVPRISIERIGS
jgi:hypothetical protein